MQYMDDFLKNTQISRCSSSPTTSGQLPELGLDLVISRELEQLNSLSFKKTPCLSKAGFYAAPSYLAKHGYPTCEQDEQHNSLIWGERPTREVTLTKRATNHVEWKLRDYQPWSIISCGEARNGRALNHQSNDQRRSKTRDISIPVLPNITADEVMVYALP